MKTLATLTLAAASMFGTMACSQAAQVSCSAPIVQDYLTENLYKDLVGLTSVARDIKAAGVQLAPKAEKIIKDVIKKAVMIRPGLITTVDTVDNVTLCRVQQIVTGITGDVVNVITIYKLEIEENGDVSIARVRGKSPVENGKALVQMVSDGVLAKVIGHDPTPEAE